MGGLACGCGSGGGGEQDRIVACVKRKRSDVFFLYCFPSLSHFIGTSHILLLQHSNPPPFVSFSSHCLSLTPPFPILCLRACAPSSGPAGLFLRVHGQGLAAKSFPHLLGHLHCLSSTMRSYFSSTSFLLLLLLRVDRWEEDWPRGRWCG